MIPDHTPLKFEELIERITPSPTTLTSPDITSALVSTSGLASSIVPTVPGIFTPDITAALIATSQVGASALPDTPPTASTPPTAPTTPAPTTPAPTNHPIPVPATHAPAPPRVTTRLTFAAPSPPAPAATPALPAPATPTTPVPPAPTTPTTDTTPPAVTPTPTPAARALTGQTQGTFTNPVIPTALSVDQMTTYNLKGTAHLAGMGLVHVTGTIHSVGFVLTGQATGELTFTNSKGSVTLQLLGPEQEGFSPLPPTFYYRVVAHTGAYRQLADQGTLSLVLNPNLLNHLPQPQGTFTITI